MQVGQQLRQVGPQSVRLILERPRKKRHHAEPEFARAFGGDDQAAFAVRAVGSKRSAELLPVGGHLANFGFRIDSIERFVAEADFKCLARELLVALHRNRIRIFFARANRHAPITAIHHARAAAVLNRLDVYAQRLPPSIVHPHVGIEHHLPFGIIEFQGPAFERLLAFEVAVSHELGIQSAVTGKIDFLKEDPPQVLADFDSWFPGVDLDDGGWDTLGGAENADSPEQNRQSERGRKPVHVQIPNMLGGIEGLDESSAPEDACARRRYGVNSWSRDPPVPAPDDTNR